jgi:hypothetical protein
MVWMTFDGGSSATVALTWGGNGDSAAALSYGHAPVPLLPHPMMMAVAGGDPAPVA